ncbi:tetratricopeptide repeat protein [Ramlibacter humi]|nr:tetratricopeptide repeat protein [Ramlibacter humi]
MLTQASALYAAGNRPAAEQLCQAVLQLQPSHVKALHFLGTAANLAGEHARAETHLAQASAVQPQDPQLLFDLGTACLLQGKHAQALEAFDRSLALSPAQPEALYNRGLALNRLGRAAEALRSHEQACRLDGRHARAIYSCGLIHQEAGRPEAALAKYDAAIAAKFDFPEAHGNRGFVLNELGEHAEALESYGRAISLRPMSGMYHFGKAKVLRRMNRPLEALASFRAAAQVEPGLTGARMEAGDLLESMKRPDEALQEYAAAMAADPACLPALHARGRLLLAAGRFDEARTDFLRGAAAAPLDAAFAFGLAACAQRRRNDRQGIQQALTCVEKVLAHEPGAKLHVMRASLLNALLRFDEAVAAMETAERLGPLDAEMLLVRGHSNFEAGRYDAALQDFHQAVVLEPLNGLGRLDEALVHLLKGDFVQGWPLYEWRWGNGALKPEFTAGRKMWLGQEPLQDRTILLHLEQGYGDVIQFSRYATVLANQGAKVILYVQPPLVPLLATIPGAHQVVAAGEAPPDFDVYCPLLSVPMATNTTLKNIPGPASYLRASPAKAQQWRERLGPRKGPRIGIVCSGNTDHARDALRSVPLASLLSTLPEAAQVVVLQRELRESDARSLQQHGRVLYFGEQIQDFSDTAALCAQMDLVIAVDTSVAHLAGALGVPTWLLLSFAPDWRWLLDREDSPWYPSMRLFRQHRLNEGWEDVLQRVRGQLMQRFNPAPVPAEVLASA